MISENCLIHRERETGDLSWTSSVDKRKGKHCSVHRSKSQVIQSILSLTHHLNFLPIFSPKERHIHGKITHFGGSLKILSKSHGNPFAPSFVRI